MKVNAEMLVNAGGGPAMKRGEGLTDGRGIGPGDVVPPVRAKSALAFVRVHRAGQNPETFELDPNRTYTLGRSSSADIQFDDERVSRIHATLRFDHGWGVVDAMSSNGTHVCRADEYRRTIGTDEPLPVEKLRPGELGALGPGSAALVGSRHQWIELLAEPPLKKTLGTEPGADTRVSTSGRRFHEELLHASRHGASVFLLGASGSGKTHAAGFIHDHSGARGRFVAVNCAALPADPTQLRSTLFGHVKGAFTGADKEVRGLVYEAHEGTLFLDEVESLSAVAQGFLLNVIEHTGNLLPLGVSERDAPRAPAVRFISASKLTLKRTGLRVDLTHRLADGDLIRVPSLAERREDIPGLVGAFLDEIFRTKKLRARLSPKALKEIVDARWPGEVRQLRSVVDATVRA
ncbi:MAG TPA: sigma 54-interacting transcriptional regulator, partial [Myxococcota bacterium]